MLTQRERTTLVTADIRDTPEALQSVELSDNDMLSGHHPGSSRHCERQYRDERLRDDSDGCGDTVKDDLVCDSESGNGEYDDDEEDRTEEQEVRQLRQLDLQRSPGLQAPAD